MEEKTGKVAVKERPMLFSAPMVRALLDGSKTQTRRIVKDLPNWEITEICSDAGGTGKWMPNGPSPSGKGMAAGHWRLCPYGKPGDSLWVRETFQGPLFDAERMDEFRRDSSKFETPEFCVFAADGGGPPEFQDADDNLFCRWRPSIHMPRWASRIQLEIVAVRVERLNACSDGDAVAEGIGLNPSAIGMKLTNPPGESMAIAMYRALWDSINGAGSWATNPWVWVVEFKRVTP